MPRVERQVTPTEGDLQLRGPSGGSSAIAVIRLEQATCVSGRFAFAIRVSPREINPRRPCGSDGLRDPYVNARPAPARADRQADRGDRAEQGAVVADLDREALAIGLASMILQ